MNHILDELEWRGLIAQTTDLDDLRTALSDGPVSLFRRRATVSLASMVPSR